MKKKYCYFCKKLLDGMGHNPEPVPEKLKKTDRCCTESNKNIVIPTRRKNILSRFKTLN